MFAFLINPDLRNPVHKEYRKVQIVSNSLFIILIALLIYSTYFFVYKPSDTIKNYTNFTGIMFLIIGLITMRISKNITPILYVLLVFSLVATSISIYHTGGIYSVDISWLLLSMVTACFFLNMYAGITFFICSSIYIIFLYIVENNQTLTVHLFSAYPNIANTNHYFFTWIFVMLFLLILAITYIKTLAKANLKIETLQKNQLLDLTRLVEAKNDEINNLRSKLAQDFHDEVGNKLASIRMLAETIAFKSDQNMLEKSDMIQILKTIENRSINLYQGTKDFIWSLSSKSDKFDELFEYISTELAIYFNLIQIDFDCKCNFNNNLNSLIQPSISRQIIILLKEFSSSIANEIALEKTSLTFDVQDKYLNILLLYKTNQKFSDDLVQIPIKNNQIRMLKFNTKVDYKILENGISYSIQVSLS